MSVSMFRNLTALICILQLTACMSHLADRVLSVKVNVVSENGVSLDGCSLGLYSVPTDRLLDVNIDIEPQFINSFINPPARGEYRFRIACPGRSGVFVSPIYNFLKDPDFYDFGVVVIEK